MEMALHSATAALAGLSTKIKSEQILANGPINCPTGRPVIAQQRVTKKTKKKRDPSQKLSQQGPPVQMRQSVAPQSFLLPIGESSNELRYHEQREGDSEEFPILNIDFEEVARSSDQSKLQTTHAKTATQLPGIPLAEGTQNLHVERLDLSDRHHTQGRREKYLSQNSTSEKPIESGISDHSQPLNSSQLAALHSQMGRLPQAGFGSTDPKMDSSHQMSSERAINRVTKTLPKPRHRMPCAAEPVRALPSTDEVYALLTTTIGRDKEMAAQREREQQRAFEREIKELKQLQSVLQVELNAAKREKNDHIAKEKKDTEKLRSYAEKVSTIQKFINGVNNDLNREKSRARDLHQQIAALAKEGRIAGEERDVVKENLALAIESLAETKDKLIKECACAQRSIQTLEHQKSSLEQELTDKSRRLIEETNGRKRLEEQISKRSVEQASTEREIKNNHRVLLQKLAQIEVALLPSDNKEAKNEMEDLAKQIEGLYSREFVGPDDLRKLESLVGALESRYGHALTIFIHYSMSLTSPSIINRLAELKDANTGSPEVAVAVQIALDLEKKLQDQFAILTADIISTQDLQSKIAQLREVKASADERSLTKDQQITDLQTQLQSLRDRETNLTKTVAQMELQLAEHPFPHEEELRRLNSELNEAHGKLRSIDESDASLAVEVKRLKKDLKAKEAEVASITSQKAESERRVSVRLFLLR
jgi:hypothetical protein